MKPSSIYWLLLATLMVGVGLAWVLFGGMESREHPGERTELELNARSSGIPRKPLPSRYRHLWSSPSCGLPKADVSAMNADQVIEHLVSLNGIVKDPRRGAFDGFEAMYAMQKVMRDVNLDEAEAILKRIMVEPELNPSALAFTNALIETLLERVVENDMDRALAIVEKMDEVETDEFYLGRSNKMVIADILSREDAEAAIAFMRQHRSDAVQGYGGPAFHNIGRFAAQQGPEALLALEDVLGTYAIDSALETIPLERCEAFAEKWLELDQGHTESPYHVRSVLERWSRLAPEKAVEWYRSKPGLADDVQLSYAMMSIMLQAHEKQGLKFAEAEFQDSESKSRRMFTIAVNSNRDPEMWVKLAGLMPEETKPTSREFSSHTGLHRLPDPKEIVAAAQCIGDEQERYTYLQNVLGTGGRRHPNARMWNAEKALEAREQLEVVSLPEHQKNEILKLYDEMAVSVAGEEK